MQLIRTMIKVSANAVLSPFGYQISRVATNEKGNGFPRYLNAALQAGMDVNDWEEQILGWDKALPILEQTTFPYLREDSIVCNLGPGTGRWARHITATLTQGELHLVDYSPWMVNFLREYFQHNPRVHVHLNDGYSLPWADAWIDLVFSGGTLIALKLGHIYLYSREFFRVLKRGGYCVVEYIDATSPEGWNWLETQSNKRLADCYTYHTPELIERVFSSGGFEIIKRHQIGRSTFLVVRKPSIGNGR